MGADAARARPEASARWSGARSAGAASPARSAAASRCRRRAGCRARSSPTRARRCRRARSTASSTRSTRWRRRPARRVPQIALNWLLQRPTVATLIIGARNEEQLRQNLGAVGWNLTPAQIAKLDAASAVPLPYPVLAPARHLPGAQPACRLVRVDHFDGHAAVDASGSGRLREAGLLERCRSRRRRCLRRADTADAPLRSRLTVHHLPRASRSSRGLTELTSDAQRAAG